MYFMCEADGVQTDTISSVKLDSCDKESISSLVNPITTIISFIIIGLYPAVNLVFVVHIRDLKDKCLCCKQTRQVEYSFHGNRPYSHYRDGWSVAQASESARARHRELGTGHF